MLDARSDKPSAMPPPLRIYCDTSVIGGCFDEAFSENSNRLIELVRHGRLTLLLSDVTLRELSGAPPHVRNLLDELPIDSIERVTVTPGILALRDAYIQAGIVGPRWVDDATHVAAATIARADAIVSWNFKHIVRLDKIKAYNTVNQREGYGSLTILTPIEVTDENTHTDE